MASEALHLELGAEANKAAANASVSRSKASAVDGWRAAVAAAAARRAAKAELGAKSKEEQELAAARRTAMAAEDQALAGSAAEATKEVVRQEVIRLPDWYVKRIQEHGVRRPRPLPEGFLDHNPKLREMTLAMKEKANALADVKEDILTQVRDKGYAEVMVEERADGVINLRIIPKPDLDRTEDDDAPT